jgi:hypothetical protein
MITTPGNTTPTPTVASARPETKTIGVPYWSKRSLRKRKSWSVTQLSPSKGAVMRSIRMSMTGLRACCARVYLARFR